LRRETGTNGSVEGIAPTTLLDGQGTTGQPDIAINHALREREPRPAQARLDSAFFDREIVCCAFWRNLKSQLGTKTDNRALSHSHASGQTANFRKD
jgi:hypothetical protein